MKKSETPTAYIDSQITNHLILIEMVVNGISEIMGSLAVHPDKHQTPRVMRARDLTTASRTMLTEASRMLKEAEARSEHKIDSSVLAKEMESLIELEKAKKEKNDARV